MLWAGLALGIHFPAQLFVMSGLSVLNVLSFGGGSSVRDETQGRPRTKPMLQPPPLSGVP